MPTAEELERKKRREAEEQWKKILAHYMMEGYSHQQERVDEILHSPTGFYQALGAFIGRNRLLDRLFEEVDGEPSIYELLSDLEKDGDEDIQFEKRLRRQTVLLRKVMPPKLYGDLLKGLRQEGYAIDA